MVSGKNFSPIQSGGPFFMTNAKILLLILTLLVLISASFLSYKSFNKKVALPSEEFGVIFFLNEEEVKALKKRALEENDSISAKLLSRYYGSYVKDPTEARKWINLVLKAEGKPPPGDDANDQKQP